MWKRYFALPFRVSVVSVGFNGVHEGSADGSQTDNSWSGRSARGAKRIAVDAIPRTLNSFRLCSISHARTS